MPHRPGHGRAIALAVAACAILVLPAAPSADCAGAGGPGCGGAEGPGRDQLNLEGRPLATCSTEPVTGWFRDGRCATDENDRGSHTVCAVLDAAFLEFTRTRGNDLVTPRGDFPGLRPGQRWCLCAARWEEARKAGVAPAVVVEATNAAASRSADRASLLDRAVRPARPADRPA